VREAVSDYLRGADCRERKSEYLPVAGSDGLFKPNSPWKVFENSAADTPFSALLYPLAQVHDSFILAQSAEGMALIDQHAAHERVLFERLQDQYAAGTIAQQNVLIPVQMDLGHADSALLSDHLSELQKLGFSVEHFGSGTFVIKAVPAVMTGGDYSRLLLDILDEVKAHGASNRLEKLRDEILAVMACHPAVKVHRKLSLREMEELLHDLYSCRMPHSCPHGRPTVVRFSMLDIKKMFKRV
jgi:DNA mismatch repair protein MutL